MVFQQFNLWSHLTVLQNVMEAPVTVLRRDRAEVEEKARHYLDKVGIGDKADAWPAQLSGGQQQRAAIAARLVHGAHGPCSFDEPTSALDPELEQEVVRVIKSLADEGRTMILVTHDMRLAADVADHVVFLHQGRIEEEGTPAAVFGAPRTDRLRGFLSATRSEDPVARAPAALGRRGRSRRGMTAGPGRLHTASPHDQAKNDQGDLMKTLAIATIAALLAGAAAAQDTVRLGTEGAYPPYNYIDDSGEVAGFERELGDELCKRAELTCEWVTNDWDSIIPNLVSGNYDVIIAGMSITDERDEVIDFTQDYYPPTESAYVGLSEDVDVTTGVVSAQAATIQAGYVAESGRDPARIRDA